MSIRLLWLSTTSPCHRPRLHAEEGKTANRRLLRQQCVCAVLRLQYVCAALWKARYHRPRYMQPVQCADATTRVVREWQRLLVQVELPQPKMAPASATPEIFQQQFVRMPQKKMAALLRLISNRSKEEQEEPHPSVWLRPMRGVQWAAAAAAGGAMTGGATFVRAQLALDERWPENRVRRACAQCECCPTCSMLR
jgi:hypothetical protein